MSEVKIKVVQTDDGWEIRQNGKVCIDHRLEAVIGRYIMAGGPGLPVLELVSMPSQVPKLPDWVSEPAPKRHDLGMLPKIKTYYEYDDFVIWVTTLPRGERALVYTVKDYGNRRNLLIYVYDDRERFASGIKHLEQGGLIEWFMRRSDAIYDVSYTDAFGPERVQVVKYDDIPYVNKPTSSATLVLVRTEPPAQISDLSTFDYFLTLELNGLVWSRICGKFTSHGGIKEHRKFDTFRRWMHDYAQWVEKQPEDVREVRPIIKCIGLEQQTQHLSDVDRSKIPVGPSTPMCIREIPTLWRVVDPETLYRKLGYDTHTQSFAGKRMRSLKKTQDQQWKAGLDEWMREKPRFKEDPESEEN